VREIIPFARRILNALEEQGITRLDISNWDCVLEASNLPIPVYEDKDRCACCGLKNYEYNSLYAAHTKCTPSSDLILQATTSSKDSVFCNAIIRCNDAMEVRSLIIAGAQADVLLIPLTTEMTSARRARAIAAFCSYGGTRAKLHFFLRGLDKSHDPIVQHVMDFGYGEFRKIISNFLVQKILVADDSVDVGLDLHKHSDMLIVPRVLRTKVELQQLTGRLVRIVVGRSHQGHVKVSCGFHDNTFDDIFYHHVKEGNFPSSHHNGHIETSEQIILQDLRNFLAPHPVFLQLVNHINKRRRYH
jgi:hypothetical protein